MGYRIDWLQGGTPRGKRRLFYFAKSDHLLENLLDERLKVSEFSKCNDFFELASISLADGDLKKKQKVWMASIDPKVGLVCFSRDWRHPLMWAHYANGGTGACLVVDVDNNDLEDVHYIKERVDCAPAFEFPVESAHGFRKFCATKADFWKYEEEVRLFVSRSREDFFERNSVGFLKLGGSVQLVGIINGPRPILGANALKKAAGDVHFFQCRPANRKFQMVSNQLVGTWIK